MPKNPSLRSLLLLLSTLLCAPLGLIAQPPQTPLDPSDPSDPIAVYLTQDCGTGETTPSLYLKRVVRLGEAAVGRLLTALRQGPDEAIRQMVARQAAEDHKRLAAFVRGGGLANLVETEVIEAAGRIEIDDYVQARLQSVVRGHQERALHALERIGGPTVRKALLETATQPEIDPRLQGWILAALARLETP